MISGYLIDNIARPLVLCGLVIGLAACAVYPHGQTYYRYQTYRPGYTIERSYYGVAPHYYPIYPAYPVPHGYYLHRWYPSRQYLIPPPPFRHDHHDDDHHDHHDDDHGHKYPHQGYPNKYPLRDPSGHPHDWNKPGPKPFGTWQHNGGTTKKPFNNPRKPAAPRPHH